MRNNSNERIKCSLHVLTLSYVLQDYSSLFPLDDTQPSKLMRLLSSNEDEPVALSSPGQYNIWFWFTLK